MSLAARLDLYQLTSLVPHHRAGLTDAPVVMTFFCRRLPERPHDEGPARAFLVWAGLQRCLDHLEQARFTPDDLEGLGRHEVLGPALAAHPDLVERLARWRFRGRVSAPREGTLLLAGPAVRQDGSPLVVDDVRPTAGCPFLQIETDLLSAKLIETPLLSVINHMTMVATKAAHVVMVATERAPKASVVEFGTRRTHPAAAVDAALAAYIGGCAATSNVEAHLRFRIPVTGTMDHFAVQAWERPGVPRHETERAYFAAFHEQYPGRDILLVDTYDTFGAHTGIRNAVAATGGKGPFGIRIDSNLSAESLREARALLDALGARDTRIIASGGLDEIRIRALGDAPVDGFGIGERIVCSPDAPVGVGAIGKLTVMDGHPTTKLSKGSGKAHLPGLVQCFRTEQGDVVGTFDEALPGEPLLQPVWDEGGRLPAPPWNEVRAHALAAIADLAPSQRQPRFVTVPVSDRLAERFTAVVRGA